MAVVMTRPALLSLAETAHAAPQPLLDLLDQATECGLERPAGSGSGGATASAPPTAGPGAAPIAQRPADVADFAGREREVATLVEVLAGGASGPGRLPVAVVTGGGGLGKTTYQRAAEYFQRSLALHPPGDRSRHRAVTLGNLGDAYLALGRFDEAAAALEESVDISTRDHDRRGQADALHTLGRLFRESGHVDGARDCWKQSLDLAQEIGFTPAVERARASLSELDA